MQDLVMAQNYLPKSLSYFVKELYSKRSTLIFSPNTSSSASANAIVRVRCPTGILDLSTLAMRFKATIDGQDVSGTTKIVGAVPPAYKFIRACRFICGGVQINGQNQHYNRVKNAVIKSQCSTDVYDSHLLQNYIEDRRLFENQTAVSDPKFLIEDNFLGLPMSQSYYDTSIFGQLEIEIQLEDNTIIKESVQSTKLTAAEKAQMSYKIDDIQFSVDQIVPPSIYAVLLDQKLQTGTPLKMSFANIVSSKQSNTGSNRLNLSTKCLDLFMALPLALGSKSNKYETAHFVYPSGAADLDTLRGSYRFQLEVGEDTFPKNAFENGLYAYDMSVNAWHKNDVRGYNLLGVPPTGTPSIDSWKNTNHIISIDLTLEGMGWAHPDRVCSGIDTRNMALDLIWNSQSYANDWLLVAFTTAALVYDPMSKIVSVDN